MKRFFITLLFIILFASNLIASDDMYSDKLKIKIESYSDGYELKSERGFNIIQNDDIIETIYDDKIILKDNNGVLICTNNSEYGPYYNITIRPIDGLVSYKNNKYFGDFYLLEKDNSLINIIDMENYIYSVVANEVGSTFEIESIKAQAVAARTYALYNSKKFIKDGYNLTASTISQVYNGHNKVDEKIVKAVDETKGEVILYNNEIIDATYSSTNGGAIASAKDTWGQHRGYLISKYDPYSLNSPRVNWNYSLSLNQIDENLSKGTKKNNFKKIIFYKNNVGRVTSVDVIYDNDKFTISGERFRSRMGVANLKSTKFDAQGNCVESNKSENSYNPIPNSCLIREESSSGNDFTIINDGSNESIKFIGMGVGHGVGMSQYGANEMAKQGFNYKDILKFYYEGVEIERVYD